MDKTNSMAENHLDVYHVGEAPVDELIHISDTFPTPYLAQILLTPTMIPLKG